jgi:hypothetical protein
MLDPLSIYLWSHVKRPILRKYFCVPSFLAAKRDCINIEGYLVAFRVSGAVFVYNWKGDFRPAFVVTRTAIEQFAHRFFWSSFSRW